MTGCKRQDYVVTTFLPWWSDRTQVDAASRALTSRLLSGSTLKIFIAAIPFDNEGISGCPLGEPLGTLAIHLLLFSSLSKALKSLR